MSNDAEYNCKLKKEERCRATVWRRDCYRRTGRGSSGFEMHYSEGQCSRRRKGGEFCGLHQKKKDQGRNLSVCRWS